LPKTRDVWRAGMLRKQYLVAKLFEEQNPAATRAPVLVRTSDRRYWMNRDYIN
jgi:hypothetical protein